MKECNDNGKQIINDIWVEREKDNLKIEQWLSNGTCWNTSSDV